LRAAKILRERAFANPKIDFLWNSHLVEIKGADKVEAGIVQNKNTLVKTDVPVDGVFMYVGILPNTRFAQGVVELDEQGYAVTDPDLQTSVPGIFAAGDVRHNQLKQVSVAVGEGALAAMMAEKYLEELKDKFQAPSTKS
jgi:thioredoxin reductase (NADPH)